MKALIVLVLGLSSAGASAAAADYSHCQQQLDNELCKAYLTGFAQGVNQNQERQDDTPTGFLARALEQRAGERSRHLVSAETVTEIQAQ
ncbi:hypothetical protein IFO68_08850 [Photobacterium sp. CAU 1568]|uniref:Uncharacterized protein n=1 Tax=Photobacterium arenosum TaxID=2774143 RepID=A0ABR9BJR4_9GAMM|nr:hypothetical protein [Photobacterium arenosum]MBD8512799.1 hypothetical protein [Photobacterium arenosum]